MAENCGVAALIGIVREVRWSCATGSSNLVLEVEIGTGSLFSLVEKIINFTDL
jgi:hypothetical protein